MHAKKVMLDFESAAQFRETNGQLELCDSEGRTLGYFLPPKIHREWRDCRDLAYEWVKAQFGDKYGPEHPDDGRPPMTTAEAIRYLERVADTGEHAA